MRPFSRILVDIDSTATSHPALERAARLARGCGARLTVVDVVAPPFGAPHLTGRAIERELVCRRHDQLLHLVDTSGVTAKVAVLRADDNFLAYLDASERLTSVQFKEMRDAYDGCLADVRLELRKGEPTEVIPEYVVAHGIDTIVTGTMGRTGLTRLLFSDVAEGLLKKAPCSVLAVKPDGSTASMRLEDEA